MEATPDLSKLVNAIMQNPTLISEIASLAAATPKNTEVTAEEITESQDKIAASPVSAPVSDDGARERRKDLLRAMKPYLSEPRQSAIDSMSSILDVLDVIVKKR